MSSSSKIRSDATSELSPAPLLTIPPLLVKDNPTKPSLRTQLAHLTTLAHLLHVRNKNQHRRSHWYRHFNAFRRELHKLCAELVVPVPHRHLNGRAAHRHDRADDATTQDRVTATALKRINKDRVQQRLAWWIEAGLPEKWHTAFSHVVSTTQYSNLGLVLVALLSSVCKLVGVSGAMQYLSSHVSDNVQMKQQGLEHAHHNTTHYAHDDHKRPGRDTLDEAEAARQDAKTEKQMQRILRKFEKEEGEYLSSTGMKRHEQLTVSQRLKKRKLPVPSDLVEDEQEGDTGAELDQGGTLGSAIAKEKKEKKKQQLSSRNQQQEKHGKKKRKPNAIDDLFAGL